MSREDAKREERTVIIGNAITVLDQLKQEYIERIKKEASNPVSLYVGELRLLINKYETIEYAANLLAQVEEIAAIE